MTIVKPIGPDGRGGRARLCVRNTGDIDVRGIERVDIKTRRHGPGVVWVEVPFDVPAGSERHFDFAVDLPAAALADVFDVYLFSRGERLRPVWVTMPVAYALDTRLEIIRPAATGATVTPGRVDVTVIPVGSDDVAAAAVTLAVEPAGAATVRCVAASPSQAGAGQRQTLRYEVTPAESRARTTGHLILRTGGAGIRPATVDMLVEHALPMLPAGLAVADLPQAMQHLPWLPVERPQTPHPTTATFHVADVRLALCGDAVAIVARVGDEHPVITDMLWDGSSIEVYGCSPDRLRIGQVFGNIEIGQVFLVPAVGGRTARGCRFLNNALVDAPDIAVRSAATAEGYELSALVPLRQLGLAADAERFLFELMAQTGPYPDGRQRRATLYGSPAAFKDAGCYALLVPERQTPPATT